MVAQGEAVEEASYKRVEQGRKRRRPRDQDAQANHKILDQKEHQDPASPDEVN